MDQRAVTAYYPLQATFNNGELSPLLARRDDVDFWRKSLAQCLNFEVLPHGGIRRRSGTRFIAEVADSSRPARLFPFIFSASQAYIVAMNGGKFRFHALRGTVFDGLSAYEISHSYADEHLPALSYAQFNDTMEIAHANYAPAILRRFSETNWTVSPRALKNGPWLPEDTRGTTLRPGAHGSPVPTMSSDTAPSGVVSAAGLVATQAWHAFDRNETTRTVCNVPGGSWIAYEFGGGATKIVDGYSIAAANSEPLNTPSAWRFEGWDGASWVTLDARSGETGWARNERRSYEFESVTAYSKYRLFWISNDNNGVLEMEVTGLDFHEKASSQTPFTLTASSATGINGGAGFAASDVGRAVRLLGSDSKWRWAEIAEYTSATEVTVRLHNAALPDLSPASRWQMGAFSQSSGYPGSVGFYNERLLFARTRERPVSVFGSKQGVFDDFGVSDPLVETDAINITLLSDNMNEILWIADDIDIVAGSAGQVRAVGPADTTQLFSATNIAQRKGPTNGAALVRPLSINGQILYVGRGGTKVRELVMGDQNRYVAPELTTLAEHVFRSPIVDWAFRESPEPQVIAVLANGTIARITYDRDQKVVAVARHDVGGHVESVAVIPSATGGFDDVYVIVRRTAGGYTRRYVEVFDHAFDLTGSGAVDAAVFLDCSKTYSGAPTTIVTGMDHLEGLQVVALADGNTVRGLTVQAGGVTLPYAASVVTVGLPYTSRAVTLPVSGPQQDGTLFGRRVALQAMMIDVLQSAAVRGGAWTDGTPPILSEALLQTGGGMFGNRVELKTGTYRVETEGSWSSGGGQAVVQTDEPLPLLIRAMIPVVEGEP